MSLPDAAAMTIAQFIASLLFVASFEVGPPNVNRHALARKQLLQTLRGVG